MWKVTLPGLDLNTTIIFVILAYTLAQLHKYALLPVSDHPWPKIRKECCANVCNIQRTYIFSYNSDSTKIYSLYVQSYIHVSKWIFCKHMWIVKLLRIGVLYLNEKACLIFALCQLSGQKLVEFRKCTSCVSVSSPGKWGWKRLARAMWENHWTSVL